jgi:hypothetical protein
MRAEKAAPLLTHGAVRVVAATFEEPVFHHAMRQQEKGDKQTGHQ